MVRRANLNAGLTRRAAVAGLAASASVIAANAVAQQTVPLPVAPPPTALLNTENLLAGEYLWHPELSPEGPVAIIVSLPEQLVHVYRNGVEIGVSTCSTGKPGHRTPTGVFVILQKDVDHRSSTYNNAPMPNMQRLTWGGVALHAGHLPGYPASHGCVRLPRGFSEALFGVTHLGIPVIIADDKSEPTSVVHPGLMLPPEAEAEAMAAAIKAAKKSHHSTEAVMGTHDVVSIVVSGADQTAVMFMDGVEVWRSPITIRDPQRPLGNHVYKLLSAGAHAGTFTWLAHPIHTEVAGGAPAKEVLSRFTVQDWEGAVDILGNLRPGSTMVVTDLGLDPSTRSEPDFVIIREAEDA